MPNDNSAIRLIRTHTQATLRECIAALTQAQGDPLEAILEIHRNQAQTLTSTSGAPFDACLQAIHDANGDPFQARSYLRSLGYLAPSHHETHDSAEILIYLSLKDSKPEWWPVVAEHIHGQCYRVVSENPDPEHTYWEFATGEIVECQEYVFAEHETGLVAMARCEHEEET